MLCLNTAVYVKFSPNRKKLWCSTRIVSHALPFIVILLQQTLKIKFVMEVITFESEAYKALVGKIKNTPVSDVEFHSGRMEVHIHTHKNEHNGVNVKT